jgi:hypothetical protein
VIRSLFVVMSLCLKQTRYESLSKLRLITVCNGVRAYLRQSGN